MAYKHKIFGTGGGVIWKPWIAFTDDAKKIVETAAQLDIKLTVGDTRYREMVYAGYLSINGVGDEAGEPFVLNRRFLAKEYMIDTDFKPYDAVVCAILIAAKEHLKQRIKVESDGDWRRWQEGMQLYRAATGKPVKELPIKVPSFIKKKVLG